MAKVPNSFVLGEKEFSKRILPKNEIIGTYVEGEYDS